MTGQLVYKLDQLNHDLRLHLKWPCNLLDISCGMDQSCWNLPGPPEYPVLNRVPRTWFYLAADWWFNSVSRRRHPIQWWRHDRGEHLWGEVMRYHERILVERWQVCHLCGIKEDLPLNIAG